MKPGDALVKVAADALLESGGLTANAEPSNGLFTAHEDDVELLAVAALAAALPVARSEALNAAADQFEWEAEQLARQPIASSDFVRALRAVVVALRERAEDAA